MRFPGRHDITYCALLAGAFALAVAASWSFGGRLDNYAYDAYFHLYKIKPWEPQSVLLAIDEASLQQYGGMRNIRKPLADGIRLVRGARAVAVDIILSDVADEASDATLEKAFRGVPNLVLACDLMPDGKSWEEPLERFRGAAAALGHVHAQPDRFDSVLRALPLEKYTYGVRLPTRFWALSLEAFRLSRGAAIIETPDDVTVGTTVIPAARSEGRAALVTDSRDRLMRIRYLPPSVTEPRVSLKDLLEHPERASAFAGKAVFVGVTAQNEMRDRLMTPYSDSSFVPGVEINAQAFETMSRGLFLVDARRYVVLLFALLLTAAAGLAFARLPGWMAYAAAAVIAAAAVLGPYVFFVNGAVYPFTASAFTAFLSIGTAAAYQTLVVRRNLRRAENERARYQQAMHFVTHEMKTPLTAIQGSSELMSRYALTEEKRKHIANMINSESKRLARMIEMFLNVERLSAGQMELRKETFAVVDLVATCVERARVLAGRKQIGITLEPVPAGTYLTGDRELIEYACYNLLSNAVKYSPRETQVTVSVRKDHDRVRVAVQDQGIGMDQKEIKRIFQKFYRTKKAEQSGESGTGIGLSIVEQIVTQHGGAIDVTSRPGEGSCFTLVLPAAATAAVPAPAERH